MAGDEADLVAEPEAVGGARDAEPTVLVAHQRRAGVEGEHLQAGVDDGAVVGRAVLTVAQTLRP